MREVVGSRKKVAGIDGAPGGWAVVVSDMGQLAIQRVTSLHEFFNTTNDFDLVAIDIPIGLLDAYEIGGRSCDRAARAMLGTRGSSVFPAPVRPVLAAASWEDACAFSRASSQHCKAISKQTFGILPKIREADDLLQRRPELRKIVREVHPEVCFRELLGAPIAERKSSTSGKRVRRTALRAAFPELDDIETAGRSAGLPVEDILDAAVACWSARRLADGRGRSLRDQVSVDSRGLEMTIWV